MRKNPAAALGSAHVHAPELGPRDSRDAVKAGQALVEEGVIGVQQLEHAAVILDDIPNKQLGLAAHRLAQALVEHREALQVRPDHVDILELEPLPGEILDQRGRLLIAQHPFDLSLEYGRLAQTALSGDSQELGVGHAAPQKVGEARGKFIRADGCRGLSGDRPIPLDAIQKIRRHQRGLERRGDALLERVALLAGHSKESEELVDFFRRRGTAIRAAGEACQNCPRAGVGVLSGSVPADVDPAQALGRRRRDLIERPAHVNGLEAVVDASLDGVRLDLGSVLAQRLDILLTELAVRVDQRLGRALRRLGSFIARRKAVVVAQIRFREQMVARSHASASFDDLALQISSVDFELLDQLAVDE